MEKIVHSLFEFNIPKGFDVRHENKISSRVQNNRIPYEHQPSFVKVGLGEIADIDNEDYQGATFLEKLEDAYISSSFMAEKLLIQEIDFKGYKTYVIHAKTDAVFQKKHYKIRMAYYLLMLDDRFYLEFAAHHEMNNGTELLPWVVDAFESLEVYGDKATRHAAIAAFQADLDAMVAKRPQQEEAKASYEVLEIPEDGKEQFTIGELDLVISEEHSKLEISTFGKDLSLHIQTEKTQPKKNFLSEYNDGVVALRLNVSGVHSNGHPIGVFTYENGKTGAPLHLHMYLDGVDSAWDFYGTVRFEREWVLVLGELRHGWENKSSIPIKIIKQFNIENLDWSAYRFKSMDEAATAQPKDVRFLILTNPDFEELPDALFEFSNLEELYIAQKSNHWDSEKIPLKSISERIGVLKKLSSFHVNGAHIKKLPNALGALKQLKSISVNNCELLAVPENIWSLPKLEWLSLQENSITVIPDTMNLPVLKSINLKGNKLKTLPERLAKQPFLNRLKIEDNPLESLPEEFNTIEKVELSMADKKRLLDFEYKGADGKGTTPWDDTVFWSQNDPELLPEIKRVVAENKLEEHAKGLQSLVKKSIGFAHDGEEKYNQLGNHRFGGMPDLPETIPYPRFGENWRDDKDDYTYEFIGQINCSEIADLQAYLPRTGMLFFFLETIHNIYGGNNNPVKVIYCENTDKLSSGKRFQFSEEDYSEMYGPEYTPYKVKATKMNSAPSFYASYVNTHLFLGEAKKLREDEALLEDLYDRFEEPLNEKNPFEYAVNAYGFAQHEHPELQASLKKKGNPEDWMVLLTVTSSGDMQWGDAGDLFFVIHKSDLAKRDFSNVFVTIESS